MFLTASPGQWPHHPQLILKDLNHDSELISVFTPGKSDVSFSENFSQTFFRQQSQNLSINPNVCNDRSINPFVFFKSFQKVLFLYLSTFKGDIFYHRLWVIRYYKPFWKFASCDVTRCTFSHFYHSHNWWFNTASTLRNSSMRCSSNWTLYFWVSTVGPVLSE